ELGSGACKRCKLIEIKTPVIFRTKLRFFYAAAKILRQSPDLPVTRRDDDYLVIGLKQRAANHPVGLRCTNGDQNIFWRSVGIERGDALAQQACAVHFRIVKREFEQRPGIFIGQQIANVGAFYGAIGEVDLHRALKLRLEILKIEILKSHNQIPWSLAAASVEALCGPACAVRRLFQYK